MAFLFITLALLLPGKGIDQPPFFQVIRLDGQQLTGQLSLLKGETLFLSSGDRQFLKGHQGDLKFDDVLFITASETSPNPEQILVGDRVHLASPGEERRGSDFLVGRIVGGDPFGVDLLLHESAVVHLPYEIMDRILPRAGDSIDRLEALDHGGFDDRVWQRRSDGTLDSITGVIDQVDGETLALEGRVGSVTLPLDGVLAAVIAEPEGRPAPTEGFPVTVRLRSGSLFVAGLLALADGEVTFATRFTERLVLPVESVSSLIRREKDTVLLADLKPVEVEQWPSIGDPEDFLFPWRRNLSVTGRDLSVGGIVRASGLGVHSTTRMVLALPPRASTLRVTVGLCDEVEGLPAQGSVRCTLSVDGEVVQGPVNLGPENKFVVFHTDGLKGASSIEILTDDGGDDDAGDRAAWVDGVILLESSGN